MKRERHLCEGYEVSLSKVWPIFSWELCVVCKKEFRREYGWRHTTHGFRAIWRHVCCECCPTEKDALSAVEKYAKEWREKMAKLRPTPPSAPPLDE